MKRILVCEDEDVIREFVVINLKRAGYDVVDVNCGEEALRVYESENGNFDIALLDVMMPGIDGFQVCKELREKSSRMGIIMLTAKAREIDKVSGLMIGADDYITKPFSPSELTARVDAVYRRVSMSYDMKPEEKEEDENLVAGPFVLDVKSRCIVKDNVPIELTQVEYQILEYFLNNIGKTVFAKDLAELLELPRDYVYKYIKNLRAKIEGDRLKNVPSGGFILTE